jgi:hypothetical protein
MTPAEGIWFGTTSTHKTITGVVLPSNKYYLIYGNAYDSTSIAGFVQGSLTYDSSGTTFSSKDAVDFNVANGAGVITGLSVSSSVSKQLSLGGVIQPSTTTFTASYQTDYEQAVSLSSLAKAYTGAAGAPNYGFYPASLVLGADGVFTGASAGCSFSGVANQHYTPSGTAKGPTFDLSITFKGSPCVFPNQTLTGVAVYRNGYIYAAAPNASRTSAFLMYAY